MCECFQSKSNVHIALQTALPLCTEQFPHPITANQPKPGAHNGAPKTKQNQPDAHNGASKTNKPASNRKVVEFLNVLTNSLLLGFSDIHRHCLGKRSTKIAALWIQQDKATQRDSEQLLHECYEIHNTLGGFGSGLLQLKCGSWGFPGHARSCGYPSLSD